MIIGNWVVPTLVEHGSPEQLERFVPPSLRGDIVWCQLFSEPGAGSDLAGLRTRAEKVEGGWRVNGQKVWTSMAREADFGILLARTDQDVPKHKGLSYFLLDMSAARHRRPTAARAHRRGAVQRGVPRRRLRPRRACWWPAPGDGWKLARTTLANERVALVQRLLARRGRRGAPRPPRRAGGSSTPTVSPSSARSSVTPSPSASSACAPPSGRSPAVSPGPSRASPSCSGVAHTQEVWETAIEWQGVDALYDAAERGTPTWWFLTAAACRSPAARPTSSSTSSASASSACRAIPNRPEGLSPMPIDPETGAERRADHA